MSEPNEPVYYSDEQVQDLITRALHAHSQQSAAGYANSDEVQRAINEALTRQQSQYEAHIAGIRAEMDTLRGAGVSEATVPEHAGGPGTEIAETWSQYEQELSRQEHEIRTREQVAQLAAAQA